ncbi:hypothetical protein H6798_00115 [Candidatus Nomurabacteria bacterium]|nr:hypothetical protein [Candidatus Nomurabacteria bacterium]
MSEHPIADEIINQINSINGWFEAFGHDHVRTSEEAAALRNGYTIAQGAKALIVRAKVRNQGKQFLMLVLPGDTKFDSNKAKQVLDAKDIRFATEAEVAEITEGVKPGGVPPFGNLFNLHVIVDPKLFAQDKIIFNAGRNYSIGMFAADYKKLVKPLVADIT